MRTEGISNKMSLRHSIAFRDGIERYVFPSPLPYIRCVLGEFKDLPNDFDTSVAEVLFRTAPENQNRQNRTVKFGSVLFSPRNSWSCSVLGSYI